jgi:Phage related hypothetical protein (DUF1799)
VSALANPNAFELWPEHAKAFELFVTMSTQWHFNPLNGQRMALRYDVLAFVMELLNTPRKSRSELFADVRVLEAAALDVFASQAAAAGDGGAT